MCDQDAALHLAGGEYWDLTPLERVALLRALATLALAAEAVRDVMQARAESQQLLVRPTPLVLPPILPHISPRIRYCFGVGRVVRGIASLSIQVTVYHRRLSSQQSGTRE